MNNWWFIVTCVPPVHMNHNVWRQMWGFISEYVLTFFENWPDWSRVNALASSEKKLKCLKFKSPILKISWTECLLWSAVTAAQLTEWSANGRPENSLLCLNKPPSLSFSLFLPPPMRDNAFSRSEIGGCPQRISFLSVGLSLNEWDFT